MADFIKHISKVDAHGVSFQVESDQPLTQTQRSRLIIAFEHYPKNVVEVLSKGRDGESPLKIVYGEKEHWSRFAKTFFGKGFSRDSVSVSDSNVRGMYLPTENIIFFVPHLHRGHLSAMHEIAHAVDDFAMTKFCGALINVEDAWATDTLIPDDFVEKNEHWMRAYLNDLGYYGEPEKLKAEFFAVAITRMLSQFKFDSHPVRIEDMMKQEQSPDRYHFFESAWLFLKNYPSEQGKKTSAVCGQAYYFLPRLEDVLMGALLELNVTTQENPPWLP